MRFWAHGSWWPINRPHVIVWGDDENYGIGVDWGNGNSDPVWSVGVIFNAPDHRLLARLVDWIDGRRYEYLSPGTAASVLAQSEAAVCTPMAETMATYEVLPVAEGEGLPPLPRGSIRFTGTAGDPEVP